jgi:hypothetical protein
VPEASVDRNRVEDPEREGKDRRKERNGLRTRTRERKRTESGPLAWPLKQTASGGHVKQFTETGEK